MINKFQEGGQMDQQQQLIQQVAALVQAAMQGDQQATQQIQQIMQAAQQGDPQAQQIAQVIQAVAQQMQQGQAQIAKKGAKLDYLKRLNGECPEGQQMTYFKVGGKVCKKCQKMVEAAKCGKKVKKSETGSKVVDEFKCGRKMKKAKGGTKANWGPEYHNPKRGTEKNGYNQDRHDYLISKKDKTPKEQLELKNMYKKYAQLSDSIKGNFYQDQEAYERWLESKSKKK